MPRILLLFFYIALSLVLAVFFTILYRFFGFFYIFRILFSSSVRDLLCAIFFYLCALDAHIENESREI